MKDKKLAAKDYKEAFKILSDIVIKHEKKLPKEMLAELKELKDK